ncbi:MAG: glycyl-radical enzyme activating protein [Gemmatimonadetes bacterium]|nr:glycyl-radical enzyme activating protein [Gemmatimonadota bacterium]
MTAPSGLVFNVQRFSVHDGPGIRTTIFLKGCPLACTWCHNPESQELAPTFVRLRHRCMQCGRCTEAELASDTVFNKAACDVADCPTGALQLVGERISADALVVRVLRDRTFFETSGGGVTLSGGEPLVQAPFAIDSLKRLRAEGVHTALDTCGFASWEHLRDAAEHADLVLYDLKLMDPARHETATGVSNARILTNLSALCSLHQAVWVRIPVIPGVNDDEANIDATAAFVSALPRLGQVSLLPYHPTAEPKFARVGKHYTHHGTATPSNAHLEAIAARFRARGLPTSIGGQAA